MPSAAAAVLSLIYINVTATRNVLQEMFWQQFELQKIFLLDCYVRCSLQRLYHFYLDLVVKQEKHERF